MSNIQQFDYSANVLRALLWRHNDAANLTAIVQDAQDFYDLNVQGFFLDWFESVFDLATADIFGLTVWAILLRLPISVVPDIDPGIYFGFVAPAVGFDQAPFDPSDSDIVLTPEDARTALRMRYRSLTTNCSLENVNRALEDVFSDRGIAYVIDHQDMTCEYVFEFALTQGLIDVLTLYDVLPRPVGVQRILTVTV